jgi:hypothetical protein
VRNKKAHVTNVQVRGLMHQGQWIGRYSGTNAGDAYLELDAVDSQYEGRVDSSLTLTLMRAEIERRP